MFPLFKSRKKSLPDFFKTLSDSDIKNCCQSKTYRRGVEYYENDLITDVVINTDTNRLTAIVEGRQPYTVQVIFKKGEVSAACSCPYDDLCKHIIAVLLHIEDQADNLETVNNQEKDISSHLMSLSKEELVNLIIKFAPGQFVDEIKNRSTNVQDAKSIFKKVESDIQKKFTNWRLLEDPEAFERSLTDTFRRLSGLEIHLVKEIESIIFYIIQEVDNAIDEGHLYDHYNDKDFESSEAFDHLILKYTLALPFKEKMAFLEKMEEQLSQLSYDSFAGLRGLSFNSISDSELPALKSKLVKDYSTIPAHLIANVYCKVKQVLSNEEKEKILPTLVPSGPSWLIEYATLFHITGRWKKAASIIKSWLDKYSKVHNTATVYILYLDVLREGNQDLTDVAKEAISNAPCCAILEKITDYLPGKTDIYEKILEKRNPTELLSYLETKGRLQDGLALIKKSKLIWESSIYSFYKKNKALIANDAQHYFCSIIEENLRKTGDNYYYAISDAIKELKEINLHLANERIENIRLNYKRRPKLLSIIAHC